MNESLSIKQTKSLTKNNFQIREIRTDEQEIAKSTMSDTDQNVSYITRYKSNDTLIKEVI
ncbi:MAG: hypothetical protein CMF43_00590 [Legionellales bacterium]|nr:hypothetical protein [Legionellales bacterium]|tara:strand:+ start:897 stop:1076 length:180 start_codon:yes stop_codon:yes gene_type:complete